MRFVMLDLSNRELKLYDMIVECFLEVLMFLYEYDVIIVILEVVGYIFVLKENVIIVLGFKFIR